MKNKILILLLALFLFHSRASVKAQSNTSLLDCPTVSVPISDREAEGRRDFFERVKNNKVLSALGITVNDFEYEASLVKDILLNFAGKGYDGVRIYFALNGDEDFEPEFLKNKLYLVLVPTKPSKDSDDDTPRQKKSIDDESMMYVTGEKSIIKVKTPDDKKFVRSSIDRFLTKCTAIEDKFKEITNGIPLLETHSLWYKKEVLFDKTTNINLLSLLNNTDCHIEKVRFDFASWSIDTENDGKYSFKNDVLFELVTGETSKYLISIKPEAQRTLIQLEEKLKNIDKSSDEYRKVLTKIKLLIKDSYTNTAVPCPPAKCPK
jgi:hypothetical protein